MSAARVSTIEDGLRALGEPGTTFEVRALKVQRNGNGYQATCSGYFDNPEAAARGIADLDGRATGIYVTINPTKPELLARASNRVREVRKDEPLTTDSEIVRRTRLLVDVDPVRPAGISATEAEHRLARVRAEAIRDELKKLRWPDPLLVDSGNGAQLLYAIDLPANDDGLVRAVLAALAFRFDDDAVRVDVGNFNPSRICKVPGTLARKGDDTPERPHRRAMLLSQPIALSPVSRVLLEAVAAWVPAPEKPTRTSATRPGDALDLTAWLDRHGIEGRKLRSWRGGIIVDIQCPVSTDHGFEAWVGQDGSGMLSASCFHATCSLKTWRDLRDRYEPRRGDPPRSAPQKPAPPADATEVDDAEAADLRRRLEKLVGVPVDAPKREAEKTAHDTPAADQEPAGLREEIDAPTAESSVSEAGEARTREATDPWDDPLDFSEPTRAAFPVSVLPAWLGEYVESLAMTTQTPPDLAGCLALSAVSASIARRYELHPRPDWREPANIYTAVVLPPGHRKSAVFARVQEPIIEAEREACVRSEPTIAEAETKAEHLATRIKRAQSEAGGLSGADADEALREVSRLKVELRSMRVPPRPQYAVDDCTPERLQTLLAAHGERMALFSSEGDVFDMMAGRYSAKADGNLGVYLKAHSGDELRVDRVSRPAEHLRKPALTVGLAIQPDVLHSIQSKPGFRGRGLLARFLYSLPMDALGSRDPDPDAMPEEIGARYSRRVRSLWQLPTTLDEAGMIVATPLPFSFEARDMIVGFQHDIEPRLGRNGDLEAFTDWAGKLAGAVVRLSGVLHMADLAGEGEVPPGEIQAATVSRGIALGSYFLDHAVVAFRAMRADETADDAGDLLAWLRKQARELPGFRTFTRREAHYARKHRFAKADDLEPALAFLVEHGWIRTAPEPETRGSGRPSKRFEVHPEVTRC